MLQNSNPKTPEESPSGLPVRSQDQVTSTHTSNRLGGWFPSHSVLGTTNWKEGNINPIGSTLRSRVTAARVDEMRFVTNLKLTSGNAYVIITAKNKQDAKFYLQYDFHM